MHESLRSSSPSFPQTGNFTIKWNKKQKIWKKNPKKTELKEGIKALKLFNKEKAATKNLFSNKQNTDSENVNLAFTTSGGQNETVQLLTIINFIKDTVTTLSNWSQQIKTQLDFSLTQ